MTKDKQPPSWQIQSQDSSARQLIHYDEEAKETKALRYCENQKSFYKDEQDEHARLTPIVFTNGSLVVESKRFKLQEFLSAHPGNVANGGNEFYEKDPEKEAEEAMALMDLEDAARDLAREIDPDDGISILVEFGVKKAQDMTSSEIRRDLRIYASREPSKFLEIAKKPTSAPSKVKDLMEKAMDLNLIRTRPLGDADAYMKNYKDVKDGKKMLIRIEPGETPIEKIDEFFKSGQTGRKEFIELEKQVDLALNAE